MFFDLSGVRVYHESAGSGRSVLLLHGWGARASAMRPIFDSLASQFAVHAIDFPGFGQSSPPPAPWSVGDYCGVVAGLAERLQLERVCVIGHSFGGRVGIMLAAERPDLVDKLVLVDSAGVPPTRGAGQRLTTAAIQAGRSALRLPGLGGLRTRVEHLAHSRLGSDDYRQAGPLRETFVKVVNEDLRPLLPQIKAPTLLVWGDGDDVTPLSDARLMEKAIPDAGLVVLAGAGHFSYLDRVSDFTRIVRVFLAQP